MQPGENGGQAVRFLVNIDVDDLDRAVGFYSEAIGLRPGRRIGDSVVEMLGGPAAIYLVQKPAGTIATPQSSDERHYNRHWTPLHLDFEVDDIATALQKAVAAGASLEQDISRAAWGSLALLADPFGHGFCLVEFHGRGYDEISV